MPAGLSKSDDEALDHLFDEGSIPRMAPDDLAERFETPGSAHAKKGSPSPTAQETHDANVFDPGATERASGAVASAASSSSVPAAYDSFLGDSLRDLAFDQSSAGHVWQQLEAALPPALPSASSGPAAPVKPEAAKAERKPEIAKPAASAMPRTAPPSHAPAAPASREMEPLATRAKTAT